MDKDQFPQEEDSLNPEPSPVPNQENPPEEPEIVALSFASSDSEQAAPIPPLPEESAEPVVFPETISDDDTAALPEVPFWETVPDLPDAPFPEDNPADVPAQTAFPEPVPDTEGGYAEEAPAFHAEPLDVPAFGDSLDSPDAAPDPNGMMAYGEDGIRISQEPELSGEAEDTVSLPVPEDESDLQEYRDISQNPEETAEAPAPEPEQKPHTRPVRKGRPKRKKGEGLFGIPNILATVVWLVLILAIGVTAGRMLWVCAADVLAFGRENKPVTVTIYEADTMDSITDKLYNAGLIRYKGLFQLYASISDAEEKIKPGIYDLNTLYDYHALVNFMTPRSSREVIELTIPEGYTCRQIFDLLEENRVCTAVDVAAYAANGELKDYWFLENVARGDQYCLEGFLFPDTYEFYKNSSPREALERMLNNFETRFNEEMRAQIDTLNETVTGGGYTVREVTIVASLIEKESAAPAESPSIAGVIYNRLFNWDGNPAYLNIDAAIVYAQGGNADTIDTSLDSPYNTYTHTGLTPTPISNPGLASLQAALQPESHNYYYYVLNPSTGMHQFAATQEEHNANIAAFYG